jgi:hypothetical protein
MVNQVQPTVVTETEGGFGFPEGEGVEGAPVRRGSDLHGDAVVVAVRVDGQDFGAKGVHGRGLCTSDFPGGKDRHRDEGLDLSGTSAFREWPETTSGTSGASTLEASVTSRPK